MIVNLLKSSQGSPWQAPAPFIVSPELSRLAPPPQATGPALLYVHDARGVSVRGLGFYGGDAGVWFDRSPGGAVVDSELWGNGLALYFRQSTDGFVMNCSLHDNEVGLISDQYSSVSVRVDGVIRADQFSRVALYSTDVTQPAVCETAADLVCGSATILAAFDCPSAAGSCTAPAAAPARPGGVLPPSLDLHRDALARPWNPRLRSDPGAQPN